MTVEEALDILDALLKPAGLSDVQERVFCQVWAGRHYEKIAEACGYDTSYVRHVGAQLWQLLSKAFGEKVTKSNVHSVLRRREKSFEFSVLSSELDPSIQHSTLKAQHCDWGEAIDVSVFYDRSKELDTLEQWIVNDRCRLVTLLGMGGIGKTALSVKLAQQIQDQFEYLIWRSLRNAPPVQEILATLIKFLSSQQESSLPETTDAQVSRLLEYLRTSRCLLLLDNAESILQSGDYAGHYRGGYEGYGQLIRCVAETSHQSCLVLTSLEQPRGLAAREGDTLPVRTLQLTGLDETAGRKILEAKGLSGSEADRRKLIECYRGNPLALRIAATSIQALFEGNTAEFLEQGTVVFNGIRDLLDQQCDRLSALEKQIMVLLAINREPVSFSELQAELISPGSKPKLLEALESLKQRSLIEKSTTGFTQQPVVMEYMTEQFIEQVCEAIPPEDSVESLSNMA